MTYDTILILVGVGVLGGAWNAVAGGATLFTFPALIAVGLPPIVANATNYLAILPSNAAALPGYRQELKEIGRAIWPLMIVSGAGAIVGSILLTLSDPELFVTLIPLLILFATALFAFGDRARALLVRSTGGDLSGKVAYTTLFLSSIYGGYFGAGLGIILLGIAQILGYSQFHIANALKNLLATTFTVVSIVIFGVSGLIAWPEAAVMMCGSTVGGYLGGRYARLVNQNVLRFVVICFGLGLSVVYFIRYSPF